MEIVKTERQSVYTLQGIHDGFLCGISFLDENELKLDFKTLDGERWNLILSGVLALKADNFRQGNIILDVNFYEADSCPPEYLRQVFGYNEEEGRKYLSQKMLAIAEFPWTLLGVSASYGCELFALSSKSINDVMLEVL